MGAPLTQAVAGVGALAPEPRAPEPLDAMPELGSLPAVSSGRRQRVSQAIVLVLLWLSTVAYVGSRIDRDWTPHDEGLLGQTAERLLAGQLPHRDFDDAYTGGLTAYHAVAFAVAWHRLISLRLALLMAFALWVPLVYAIATRFLSRLPAALATLAAVVWSVPNYSASMPSWYNLFLATACALALLKYVETCHRGWLVGAGAFAGLSVVIKIVGVYTIMAAGLFLFWRALDFSRAKQMPPGASRPTGGGGSIADAGGIRRAGRTGVVLAAALAVGLAVVLQAVLKQHPGPGRFQQFILPGTALGVTLIVAAARAQQVRWRVLGSEFATFAVGVLAPIALLLTPYLWTKSVPALVAGVLVKPARRLASAILLPPGQWHWAVTAPFAAVFAWAYASRGGRTRAVTVSAVTLVIVALVLSVRGWAYVNYFQAARMAVPIAACALAVTLVIRPNAGRSLLDRHRAVLIVFMAVWFSFIQFPFSGAVYFCYVAPFAVLAIVALTPGVWGPIPRGVGGALLVGAVLFAALFMNTRRYIALDLAWHGSKPSSRLTLPRGGLRVSESDSSEYGRIIPLLRDHSRVDYTFCTPDCPEIYFLSGLANPTRTIYEFLNDSTVHVDQTLRTIEQHGVTAVAVHTEHRFSDPDTALVSALGARFPDSALIGHFIVRWR